MNNCNEENQGRGLQNQHKWPNDRDDDGNDEGNDDDDETTRMMTMKMGMGNTTMNMMGVMMGTRKIQQGGRG